MCTPTQTAAELCPNFSETRDSQAAPSPHLRGSRRRERHPLRHIDGTTGPSRAASNLRVPRDRQGICVSDIPLWLLPLGSGILLRSLGSALKEPLRTTLGQPQGSRQRQPGTRAVQRATPRARALQVDPPRAVTSRWAVPSWVGDEPLRAVGRKANPGTCGGSGSSMVVLYGGVEG